VRSIRKGRTVLSRTMRLVYTNHGSASRSIHLNLKPEGAPGLFRGSLRIRTARCGMRVQTLKVKQLTRMFDPQRLGIKASSPKLLILFTRRPTNVLRFPNSEGPSNVVDMSAVANGGFMSVRSNVPRSPLPSTKSSRRVSLTQSTVRAGEPYCNPAQSP
jgi:hypothetical protein